MLALDMGNMQLINDIDQTTVIKVHVLNVQCTDLTNSCAQMNNYIELINAKLISESDRAIVTMKNQLIERGKRLSNSVKGTKLSPIESIPPNIKFYGLQTAINHLQHLGKSLDVKRSQLTMESTQNLHMFEVTIRDTKGQPVTDCISALDIKLQFPNEQYDTQEQVNIVHEGNGHYTFSVKKMQLLVPQLICVLIVSIENVDSSMYKFVKKIYQGALSGNVL